MADDTIINEKEKQAVVPYFIHEGDMTRMEMAMDKSMNAMKEAKQPIMSVRKDMGTGVKYDLIEGLWVEEQDRTYDEDGDLVDTDNMGTWFISELPEA